MNDTKLVKHVECDHFLSRGIDGVGEAMPMSGSKILLKQHVRPISAKRVFEAVSVLPFRTHLAYHRQISQSFSTTPRRTQSRRARHSKSVDTSGLRPYSEDQE